MNDNTFIDPINHELKPSFKLATRSQRFWTYIIDSVIYLIFSLIVGVVIGLTAAFSSRPLEMLESIPDFILGLAIQLIYFVPQEALSGRTIGKVLMGTKAVSEDGSELTWGKALGRTLCRFIPFEPFSFLGKQTPPTGWHDRIPKTKVISLKISEEI